ncbi:MAG: GGDEF domain-containing protein [Gammaproteobacteria bacterium]
MVAKKFDGVEVAGVNKVLRLLDALRHSQTGNVIYRQVERLLDDMATTQLTTERAYVTAVNQLLNAYISHLHNGSPLQIQVRLLQTRLLPPMTAADMITLRDYVDLYARQIEALQTLDVDLFKDAINPLLESFGIIDSPARTDSESRADFVEDVVEDIPSNKTEKPEQIVHHSPAVEPVVEIDESTWPFTRGDKKIDEEQSEKTEKKGSGTPINSQQKINSPDWEDLEAQSEPAAFSPESRPLGIKSVQAGLATQVLETIASNEEFGVLLEVVLAELRQSEERNDIEDLRWTLIREVDKLLQAHNLLAEQLDTTHHYLEQTEYNSRQLSDELNRARMLSMTDELTNLPNRRAFLQRLEDEVARVQRYGFPLSMALIDLDHFKQVNDKYGHAAGDEVLEGYSKNILSIFRHHDLVARYGGEEFAVLLPNTDAEGSMRALNKVRNRAGETYWQVNGDKFKMPTFSAGVSIYKAGETASSFIERADKALYRAKRTGRNRVEMDATYSEDSGSS